MIITRTRAGPSRRTAVNNADTTPPAVVTGAARGIGRAVVDRLVRDGFRVAALDLSWDSTTDLTTVYDDAVSVFE
jgi:NAD(P)-dependent dehydrogenase (short-subunit alcohol dehydrogenase family)